MEVKNRFHGNLEQLTCELSSTSTEAIVFKVGWKLCKLTYYLVPTGTGGGRFRVLYFQWMSAPWPIDHPIYGPFWVFTTFVFTGMGFVCYFATANCFFRPILSEINSHSSELRKRVTGVKPGVPPPP